MFATQYVFQPLMSWLKADAYANIHSMSLTWPVFHPLMSWLNPVAPRNMCFMLVTAPVFAPQVRALPPLLKALEVEAVDWNMPSYPKPSPCSIR